MSENPGERRSPRWEFGEREAMLLAGVVLITIGAGIAFGPGFGLLAGGAVLAGVAVFGVR
jgi:hypothetical protein